MSRTTVKRLHLRLSEADDASRARFLVEEALRLSGHDGGERLIVLRRLDLGVIDQGFNARAACLLRDMIARAVPAESEGSHLADAVYFESADAARAALLEKLFLGLEPLAWFWPKAVPEWRRGDGIAALRLMLHLVASPQGRIVLGRVLLRAIQAGALPTILWLVDLSAAERLQAVWPGRVTTSRLPHVTTRAAGVMIFEMGAAAPAASTIAREFRRLQLARLLPVSILPLGNISRSWLLTALVPGLMPHLADDAVSCAAIAQFLEDQPVNRQVLHEKLPSTSLIETPLTFAEALPLRNVHQGDVASNPDPNLHPPKTLSAEERSMAAGLFYLARPLRLLGYDAWLKANALEASQQHGLQLLRHIAIRYRIEEYDPVWALLPEEDVAGLTLSPWRIALDRWLRKRCRLTLGKLVKRTGWITCHDAHMRVRFPLDSADVRLRRLGIDIDPGFVPWLGRSLSFVYEDKQ